MVIYFATVFDSKNIHMWSGLGYYIGQMLEKQGHTVVYLNDLQLPNARLHKAKKYFMRKWLGESYSPYFDNNIAEDYAKQIRKKVPPGSLILSPNSILLSKLDDSYKTVLYTDSTFKRLLNFYPSFTNISPRYTREADEIDLRAIQKADQLIYSSQWAAESAIRDYKAKPEKIAIVPFGPNIDVKLPESELHQVIEGRMKNDTVHLALIAVAWHRKGGNYAVEVLQKLTSQGIKAKLHIVGMRTLPSEVDLRNIVHHGFISKATLEGQQYIAALLKTCHYLLLPSRADCTPVAVSEANSFALPCLISDVGGNADVVSHDVNGSVFDFTKGPDECANYIIRHKRDPESYRQLSLSSYQRYKDELNWDTSGEKITSLLNKISSGV